MKIFFDKNTAAGRLVKALGAAAAAICCIMAATLSVFAAGEQKIELRANGAEAEIILTFPQAAAEEIASLQITLTVTADSDGTKAEFIQNSSLAAKIVESRYHSDTGMLNIYIAGTDALFDASSPSLSIGRVTVSAEGGKASASVGIAADSLKFVRGGELVAPSGEIQYPETVRLTAGGGAQLPNPPSSPAAGGSWQTPNEPVASETEQGGETTAESVQPAQSGGASDVSNGGTEADTPAPDTSSPISENPAGGENVNPADTSALSDALSRAEGYKRGTYTESSFNALRDAIGRAKTLLSEPNARQEEIDEVLLVLENAIGMLALQNDIPSGAEDYGAGEEVSAAVSDGNGGEENGIPSFSIDNPSEPVTDSGEISVSESENSSGLNSVQDEGEGQDREKESSALGTLSTEKTDNGDGEKDNGFVAWIVVLAAAASAVMAALIALNSGKKKGKKGKHSKGGSKGGSEDKS